MRGQKYKRGVQLTTELYNLIGHEKKKKRERYSVCTWACVHIEKVQLAPENRRDPVFNGQLRPGIGSLGSN